MLAVKVSKQLGRVLETAPCRQRSTQLCVRMFVLLLLKYGLCLEASVACPFVPVWQGGCRWELKERGRVVEPQVLFGAAQDS